MTNTTATQPAQEQEIQVFLGGVCGNNHWRASFMASLEGRGFSPAALFNPVVADWNEEAQAKEDAVKRAARFNLFYLGNNYLGGEGVPLYSLTEAVMGLYDDPQRTVVVFDVAGFARHTVKAFTKTMGDLRLRFPEAPIFDSLSDAADWLAARR